MARNNRRQTGQACNARNFTAVKFASLTEILQLKSVHNYGGGNSYFLNTSPSSWLIPSTTRGIMGLLPIIPSVLIMFNHKRRLRTRHRLSLWLSYKNINWLPGAIIGDGDRKSRDSRAPMIWDNFSIFRTNCTILTSYIRAYSRTCQGLSRGCCHVAWSNGES